MQGKVAILRTSPETILDDYQQLMCLGEYQYFLSQDADTIVKLNLSWTRYFPSCSSQPWQVEGVIRTMLENGFKQQRLFPVENRTVVTNPRKGALLNRWLPVIERYGLSFTPLTEVEWVKYDFSGLLRLHEIFPGGIEIPRMFVGKQIVHLPTIKTHGHSTTTGAIKNSFGGLLKEVRHHCHKYMHEVLVDLLIMQQQIHPGIFAVMDGTVCGDGAGPRTMVPKVKNVILASGDSVAIDAIAARLMGFNPLDIPYIRMCHEKGLGVGDFERIELVGDVEIAEEDWGFRAKRSFVIWGDQMIRKGFLSPFERILLRSPLWVWAPIASSIYHDWLWYPTVGRARIRQMMTTEWGKLWSKYAQ